MISSPTQIEDFQACPTLWHFSHVRGLKPESGPSAQDGTIGHGLLAHYELTGEFPPKRGKLSKTVTHAILAGNLPPPKNPDALVESRFDGQEQRDANGKWIPCDVKQTLHVAGYPIDGFVDLAWREQSGLVQVWDHKFSSDPEQRAIDLGDPLASAAMPLYALHARRYWPETKLFSLRYHMIGFTAGKSFLAPKLPRVVTVDEILQRESEIAASLRKMSALYAAPNADEIPFNRRRCNVGQGCPHQSICPHFRGNKVNMTEEEAALFDDIPNDEVTAPPEEPLDEMAQMEAKLAAMKAAKARAVAPAAADPAVPPPPAKRGPGRPPKAKVQDFPSCGACNTPLDPDNSSKLENGTFKHIGCPGAATSATPPPVQAPPKPAPAAKPPPPRPTQATATENAFGKKFADALRAFAEAIEAL